MSNVRTPGSSGPGVRARFRGWRKTRPFWGGFFAIVGGLELYSVTRAPLSVVVMQGLPGLATLTIAVLAVILSVITWVQPHQRTVSGWIIIVMGLVSILVSNLGGFLIGMILLVTAGSLILAWQPPSFEDDDEYYDDDDYDDYDAEYDEGEYDEAPAATDTQVSDEPRRFQASAPEVTVLYAEAAGESSGSRRTGPLALATDFLRRHGVAGVKGFIKGNPRPSSRPAGKPEKGRNERRAQERHVFGVRGPRLRSVAAAVLPMTLLTLGGQLVIAGPAHAATGTTMVAGDPPDWWPFDWWPGSDSSDTPAPTPANPTTPTTPLVPETTKPDPNAPLQGGDIPDGVTLPPTTPDNATPEELAAAEAEAKRIAAENCKISNYPDALPALGSGNAKIAAAALNACITSQVRASNVPTPADTDLVVSPDSSAMKASLLEMTGFKYNGVQTLKTATGKKRVLAFEADQLRVGGYDQAIPFNGGVITNNNPDTDVFIKGHVKLYVTEMKGKAFGLVPLTFSPDQPPPLVIPYLLFTDTVSQVALVEADTILLDNLSITAAPA